MNRADSNTAVPSRPQTSGQLVETLNAAKARHLAAIVAGDPEAAAAAATDVDDARAEMRQRADDALARATARLGRRARREGGVRA